MALVSIAGLERADVLCALFNAAKNPGLGRSARARANRPMQAYEARLILKAQDATVNPINDYAVAHAYYFRFIEGRTMKINITGEEFDSTEYNIANGVDLAERTIAQLRAMMNRPETDVADAAL